MSDTRPLMAHVLAEATADPERIADLLDAEKAYEPDDPQRIPSLIEALEQMHENYLHPPAADDLEELSAAELRVRAKDAGHNVASNTSKKKLLELLRTPAGEPADDTGGESASTEGDD